MKARKGNERTRVDEYLISLSSVALFRPALTSISSDVVTWADLSQDKLRLHYRSNYRTGPHKATFTTQMHPGSQWRTRYSTDTEATA